MKLFIDECVYRIALDALRSWGHDTMTVQEAGLSGETDERIFTFAINEGRVLVTSDSDFSNIRYYRPSDHAGIIFLKVRSNIIPQVHKILQTVLKELTQGDFSQTLVIVDRNKYRIRRG